jgi:type II pantothenate kinase
MPMPTPSHALGIDAGATLCKLAWWGEQLATAQFAAGEVERIREFAKSCMPRRVVATGGGAEALGEALEGVHVEHELEFTAWARGAPVLAAEQGVELPARYLLASIGTGTSVLALAGKRFRRVGGTALGGGTLLGLGRLLLGSVSFAEISALAERGDRRKVDLLVGDIYSSPRAPLPPELNAASFAKLASRAPADLAHALTAMIGENIGLLCGEFARAQRMDCVVYGGSTLSGNPALERALRERAGAAGLRTVFLEKGAFCGAVGAAVKHGPSSGEPDEPQQTSAARP